MLLYDSRHHENPLYAIVDGSERRIRINRIDLDHAWYGDPTDEERVHRSLLKPTFHIEQYDDSDPSCQICGEAADDEMGEFALPNGDGIVAHGQCGLDHGLPTA